ncbi:hypothetical protein JCM8097_007998 [Rhodosporidiobolus ruineniae]
MFRPTGRRLAASFGRRRPLSSPLSSEALPRRITPQLAFTVGGAGLAIGGAAYYTNKDTQDRAASSSIFRRSFGNGLSPSLARSRFDEAYERARRFVDKAGGSRLAVILAENWLEMGEAKRTAAGLIASFGGVFLLWRLPGRRIGEWLSHNPLSGKSVTLLTSVFSHRTPMHLAFNSIALYSFGTACFSYLNHSDILPRSTSRYEFLAFFATAGLVSSFASHLWFSRVVAGRLLRQLPPQAVKAMMLPSLGASGAVYGCVALTALAFPETSVSLIFLPFFPIPIGAATATLVAVDLVGLIRGWRMFDHAAHLAGAVSGAAWYAYGHAWFERLRLAMWTGEKEKRRLVTVR